MIYEEDSHLLIRLGFRLGKCVQKHNTFPEKIFVTEECLEILDDVAKFDSPEKSDIYWIDKKTYVCGAEVCKLSEITENESHIKDFEYIILKRKDSKYDVAINIEKTIKGF